MKSTTLKEYQLAAMQTAGDHGNKEMRLLYSALAITGEAGEFADEVKKQVFHGRIPDRYTLASELGDVLWGVAYAAEQLGFTLEDIAEYNLAKLAKRYPKGFTADDETLR